MSNEHLIKSAQLWALVVVLFGVIVFGSNAGSSRAHLAQQNANQNSNANTNQNANTNTNTNTSGAQAATTGMSSPEQKFMMDTALAGLMEVELGRWAAQKGTSEEVKQFGRRMVEDHSKVITELTQLASTKGVTLPAQLDEKHQKNVSKISRLTGAEFDKAYSKTMVKNHEKSVSNFEKQSQNAADADLKAFAAKALPTVQEHLQMARALPGNTGTGNSNANSNSNTNSNSNSNRNSNSNNSNRP